MKLLAWLKVSAKSILRDFPVFFLTFAVYPLFLAGVMGFMQERMFTPVINQPLFSVAIVDEDHSSASLQLAAFLEHPELASVLTLVDSEADPDFTLQVPLGYEQGLMGHSPVTLQITMAQKASTSLGYALQGLVGRFNHAMSENLALTGRVAALELPEAARAALLADIEGTLARAQSQNAILHKQHSVRRELTSHEYYSTTFISFTFVMLLISLVSSDAMEKENGVESRILSTPLTRFEYYHYELAGNCLLALVATSIYVGAYRLSGLSLTGSLPLLLAIVCTQSLLITLLGTLISLIFKKKYGLPLLQAYLIFQATVGGMVGPLHKWTNSAFLEAVARFKPDMLITNSYKFFILENNWAAVAPPLLSMLAVSLGLYALSLLALKLKWGELL